MVLNWWVALQKWVTNLVWMGLRWVVKNRNYVYCASDVGHVFQIWVAKRSEGVKCKYHPLTPQKWVETRGPQAHVGPTERTVENRWPSLLLSLMEIILFIVFIDWNKPHHLPLDQHRLQKWICTLPGATASAGSTLSPCCRLHLCSDKVNSCSAKFAGKFYCCSS